jgi:hypothetical protein
VIKIQSAARGRKARKELKEGKHFTKMLLDEPGLEYKHDITMNDGGVYTGQMRGSIRHGYGIQTWPDGKKYIG